MKIRKGFTMIELMIVILVIAILAAIAIPMMTKRMEYAKWSEAEGTMAQLGNDIRTYMEKWGTVPTMANLGYPAGVGLGGQYFDGIAYTIGAATAYTDRENMNIVVVCSNGANTSLNKPKATVGLQTRTLTVLVAAGNATSTLTGS